MNARNAPTNPLIVTAYTALDYLIEQLPALDTDSPEAPMPAPQCNH